MKYGFVVLNYNNYSDTIECVNSILRIERDDYGIVVVDNCSPNDSFVQLMDTFGDLRNVEVLKTRANLGYSAGNNAGIRYLVREGIERVIIATNDTVILTHDILDRFDALELKDVGIVGPDIIVPDGSHQNPQVLKPGLLYLIGLYLYRPYRFIRSMIYRFFPTIERSRREFVEGQKKSIKGEETGNNDNSPVIVYMLHGCFFYLTENFISKIGLLDENIFMYHEEDLLAWECDKAGLDRLYMPGISIMHKDRKSTETTHNSAKNTFIETQNYLSRCYVMKKIGYISLLVSILRFRRRRKSQLEPSPSRGKAPAYTSMPGS